MVKAQIQNRLYREKRTKDFDEFVKKLREEARVTVNDAELEKVTVSGGATPPGMPPGMGAPGMGAPGMPPGTHGAVPAPPPGAPAAPAPAAAPPAPAPAPAR
jgi:peptidyl-prolyl cis-trans isomerase C